MKKKFKAFCLFISSIIIGLLHLPFAFAKSATGSSIFYRPVAGSPARNPHDSLQLIPILKSAYDSLSLGIRGMSREAFEYARKGLNKLLEEGKLLNDSIISIIDFSQPSSQKRMYVLDLKNYKVLFNTLVAHGRNSGKEFANTFSNQGSSFKSSPGFYITRDTYEGKNGYSLKLDGMERGINDNAYERGIVIHGAPYVCDALVNSQGYIGRSQGCPAVPVPASRPLINTIRNGTCLFIYHPSYVNRSLVLR